MICDNKKKNWYYTDEDDATSELDLVFDFAWLK